MPSSQSQAYVSQSAESKPSSRAGRVFLILLALTALVVHQMGLSEWSTRIVPAIFGIAKRGMIYLLSRKTFGDLPLAPLLESDGPILCDDALLFCGVGACPCPWA